VGFPFFYFQIIDCLLFAFANRRCVSLPIFERVKNMEKMFYTWEIHENDNITENRYCHNCGRKVEFTDSGIRRHNANGKDIFEFAIYKCERGHTWNKMLGILKPTDKICKFAAKRVNLECRIDKISIDQLKSANVKEIEIYIKELGSKMRLDKLLSQQIIDLSRNQIGKLISCEKIKVNNQRVKQGVMLKREDRVTIEL